MNNVPLGLDSVRRVLDELRISRRVILEEGEAAGVPTDVVSIDEVIAELEGQLAGEAAAAGSTVGSFITWVEEFSGWCGKEDPSQRGISVLSPWREFLYESPTYQRWLDRQVDTSSLF